MENNNLKPGENKVFFDSGGKKLAGLLYLPPDYQEGQKHPGIVVTRPASGVKEQTAGLYAQKFAEKGFVTLAFDPKGYGNSEGRPQVEDPFSIISDTKNAVTYVESLSVVDAYNIFNAGICMGAGYATYAASEDDRIKGTAAISPYLTGHIDYPKAYGGETVVKIMFGLLRPLTNLGVNIYFPAIPLSWWMRLMPTLPVQHGMMQYYAPGTPGDVPNWKNKINAHKADNFIFKYNPFDATKKYNKKFYFMAYADGGYSTDLIQKYYDEVEVEDKELFIGQDATHFDLYYKPEYIDPIVEKIASLFGKYLTN